ncbi:hypothetical protein [Ekhidna sp.]|uniref:hypothetical protein n=1 Tax=Ekhidna sp. TaxID=2608089 RepID=UPI003CCB9E0B
MQIKQFAMMTVFLLTSALLCAQEFNGQPTRKSIKKIVLDPGYKTISVSLTSGEKWPMKLSVPSKVRAEKVPMVVALHWGVSGNENKEFINCLMIPGIDTSQYIIISPLSQNQFWWENPKEKQLVRLIELIMEYWPVNKVIMAGYSDGATGAVHFASKHHDMIDGAIAMAGYYKPASYKVPTYVIHGVKDQLFSYSRARAILERNQQNSEQVVFISSETLSHYEACNYVELLKEAFRWIEQNTD